MQSSISFEGFKLFILQFLVLPSRILYLNHYTVQICLCQSYIVHAAFLNVVQLFENAADRAREGVHIHEHAHEVVSFVPRGISLASAVQLFQRLGPRSVGAVNHLNKVVEGARVVVI